MSEYVARAISSKVLEVQAYYPVTVLTGPRQSGKTSLCRHLFPEYGYVNLEDITTRAAATVDPSAFLAAKGNHLIIDEVQNVPELLSLIQVRVDDSPGSRYILTGSCNFSLLHNVTQSLAGRAALFTLLPFSFPEIPAEIDGKSTDVLLLQGQYPGVIVNKIPSYIFYSNYYTTYVERDVRGLLKLKNILKFDSFVRLIASRVGSEFNASSLAREVGVSSNTISEWLSILATSYIAYSLPPYHAIISKRFTKMPKVYFYDTGLLCYLLGIENSEQLERHSLRGAIFENQAMCELIKMRFNEGRDPNLSFYREYSGTEIDAILTTGSGLKLFEIKSGKTFKQEFLHNIETVKVSLPAVSESSVIYDGTSVSPLAINIRDI